MKLAPLFVTGFLFALSMAANAQERIVELSTSSGTLEGTYLSANSNLNTKSGDSIVILIAGSGPTDRDGNNPAMVNNSLKLLAEGLAEQGIATLRYDKRGVANSAQAGLEEAKLTFDTYIEDANQWLNFATNRLGYHNVVIAGHSEGALIGLVAAHNKHVDKYISIAGPGSRIDDILLEQLQSQPAIVTEQSERILTKLANGQLVDDVPNYLHSLFRPSIQPYMISWLQYDPTKELAQLNKPVLIIQGDSDLQVSPQQAEKLAAANRKSQKVILANMNHVLKTSSLDQAENLATYNNPSLSLHQELVPTISKFVRTRE